MTNLPDDGTLEDDEHEQGEQTVVPVFIKTPKRDTEDLEDEEGCSRVLSEQFAERMDRDVELVLSIEWCDFLNLGSSEGFWFSVGS